LTTFPQTLLLTGVTEVNIVRRAGLPFTNHHNARSTHLSFHIPRAGVCHGFAGYFEAVLYGDVTLSIHPERAAGDMLSWFPIFFPLSVRTNLPFLFPTLLTHLFPVNQIQIGTNLSPRPF